MGVFKNIIGLISDSLQINIDGPKIIKNGTDTIQIKDKDGSDGILNVSQITGLSVPSGSTDAVPKSYVDAIGLPKKSVRVLSVSNITLANLQTIDGVSLSADDRVGVIGQTDKSENGIYDVKDSASWERSSDCDGTPEGEVTSGICFSVREGTNYAGWGCILITPDPITVGTTDLEFTDWEPSAASLLKGTFNANTIVKADSDDTPVALTVDEQTLVGRITSGVIAALTATQVRTLLNINEKNTDTQLDSGVIEVDANDCLKITETVYFDAEYDNGDSGSSDTIDWKLGNKQKSTLTADCTYTFTAPPGPCNLLLKLVQDTTGGWDATWPASVKWLGNEPTWSDGGISKTMLVSFYYDGTYYWGQGTPWEA